MNIAARFLLVLAILLPLAAQAETYRVDLLMFVDRSAPGEQGRAPALPDMRRAIETGDSAALDRAGITMLTPEQSSLSSEWRKLSNSKRYQPVARISWVQKNPPEDNGPALHVHFGEPVNGISPIDGTVALTAGHYLHLDVDMLYSQSAGVSFRLHESRKLMRDELHHMDSPKLGVLARVTKTGG